MSARSWISRHRRPLLYGAGGVAMLGLIASRRGYRSPSRIPFADRNDFVTRASEGYTQAGAPPAAVPLLVAHSCLATGCGNKVWNNNIGVLRASAGWIALGRPWTSVWTTEATPEGVHYRVRAKWRAYGSLAESAADLLALLSKPRYARVNALGLLAAGDASWFEAIGRAGFYTEPVERHVPRYLAMLEEVQNRMVV